MKEEESIKAIDTAINELVYDKLTLQKAYNYYNGKRDMRQFQYLEENYGIGSPTSVKFTPLVRKHIDAIVGEYLDTAVLPKITCKDKATISAISTEKDTLIQKSSFDFLKEKLLESIENINNNKEGIDPYIQDKLQKLQDEIEDGFVSSYEMAAQNIVDYILQSKEADFANKRKDLLLDLLIGGNSFFQVKPCLSGTNIDIEILNPLNTFLDKNPNSTYVKDSYRCVIRRWLTKTQILNQYGSELSKEDREKVEAICESASNQSLYYVRATVNTDNTSTGLDNKEIIPGFPDAKTNVYRKLAPVYEVEWIEVDKDFVMHRHSGIRIGTELYIIRPVDDGVIRSQDNPSVCTLSVGGVFFSTKTYENYSLVLACADLQDTYDILFFFRDSLIANSGTTGDWCDVSKLPAFLGADEAERLAKWIAYKKGGVAILDSSQEGRDSSLNNTIYSGFDDTLKASAIQGIEIAIQRTEETCSSITGVFRERLNGINARDAVTNIKVGTQNSFIVTRQFTFQMDLMTIEMLSNCLNIGKIVYKDGLTGIIILGDHRQKIFTALPEHFTHTDYDVHIVSGAEIAKDIETIKTIVPQLIQAGALDPEILIDSLTAKSLTEMKMKIRNGLKAKKKENDVLKQLQEQTIQLQEQLKQASTEINKLNAEVEANDKAQIELEKEKLKLENEVNWFKARTDRDYKQSTIEIEKKRTDVEVMQIYDNNPFNNKIKNYK